MEKIFIKVKKSKEIIRHLKSLSSPKNVEGMARFGINPNKTLGVSIPNLRKIAKEVGKDHDLAEQLWSSGIHEARILASMIDDPKKVSEKQMERWVSGFDSWDVCDQCCMNLFDKTAFAYDKASQWAGIKEPARIATQNASGGEFVKRAGYAMMAALAFHDKSAKDADFIKFLPVIKRESQDGRNFVKKAVNWALRQIGKRNLRLNKEAIKTAREILILESKSAKWIAGDAIRELESEAVRKRLKVLPK